MDWRDRPIRSGERFIPVGTCLVWSTSNVWVFEPSSYAGGRWARVPLRFAKKGALPEVPEYGWSLYEWIVWDIDGSVYRLRIGVDDPRWATDWCR